MKLSILVASTICITALVSIFTVAAWGQTKSSFQPGTIMEVKAHQSDSQSDKTAQQYDVSVKVGNIVYVVLYTPPAGSNAVEYRKGVQVMVSVENDKLLFNDLLGNTSTVPILNRREETSKTE
jgi:uncharacterized protein YabE (DUF348 family)